MSAPCTYLIYGFRKIFSRLFDEFSSAAGSVHYIKQTLTLQIYKYVLELNKQPE